MNITSLEHTAKLLSLQWEFIAKMEPRPDGGMFTQEQRHAKHATRYFEVMAEDNEDDIYRLSIILQERTMYRHCQRNACSSVC
ncbi:hypothetical protein RMATCC62417_15025 [Rhizopus microsporus]|nr:hypothetical protein RMATCC62417_15025 [Rhizopus microsporus]